MEANMRSADSVAFQTYLAIFVDLLGHKALYDRIADIPNEDDADRTEFEGVVLSFVRSLYNFQEDVERFFRGYDAYKSELPWPPELKGLREKMTRYICKRQRFSDGLLLFVPLRSDDTHFPIGSVYRALAATAQLMLGSLARGSPIRGGVAIGGGTELHDGELFGPVIGRAHYMESEVSQYPRITVHESVLRYIAAHESIREPTTPERIYEKAAGGQCSRVIVPDVDGVPILHYLGEPFRTGLRETGGLVLEEKAKEFVAAELARYRENGNSKLALRYALLANYFAATDEEHDSEQA